MSRRGGLIFRSQSDALLKMKKPRYESSFAEKMHARFASGIAQSWCRVDKLFVYFAHSLCTNSNAEPK